MRFLKKIYRNKYVRFIVNFGGMNSVSRMGKVMYREWTPRIARMMCRWFKPKPGKVISIGSGSVDNAQFRLIRDEIEKYQGYVLRRYHNYFGNGPIKRFLIIPYDIATSEIILEEDVSRLAKYVPNDGKRKIIQIWHALGAFKVFGFANVEALTTLGGQEIEEMKLTYRYNYCLDPGLKFRSKYLESFTPGCEVVENIFNPRVDLLFNEKYIHQQTSEIYEQYPILKEKKVLLYAPTYRGITDKGDASHFMDFDRVLSQLPEEYILVLKRHPAMKRSEIKLPSPKYMDRFIDASSFNVNDLMQVSTTLINDYSSTVFDASLIGLPCLFFAPDLEDYIDNRGFYFEYTSFVPGPISKNEDELVKDILEHGEEVERPRKFVAEYFGEVPHNNAELFAEFIVSLINANNEGLVTKTSKECIDTILELQQTRYDILKMRTERGVVKKEWLVYIDLVKQNKKTMKLDRKKVAAYKHEIKVKTKEIDKHVRYKKSLDAKVKLLKK